MVENELLDFVHRVNFNTLALELDTKIVAHHFCKMWIFYEPKKVTLWNTRHFVEEYIEIVQQV